MRLGALVHMARKMPHCYVVLKYILYLPVYLLFTNCILTYTPYVTKLKHMFVDTHNLIKAVHMLLHQQQYTLI